MAKQAGAVQARPMTLSALTKQIQATAQSQGWTARLIREGDALVVDLTGPICPDPLLAMVIVQAELERFDATGLEAIKLCGYATAETTSEMTGAGQAAWPAPGSPGWVSVIDLDQYFARRAKLPPEAFGLSTAEASRMACAAERDRVAAPARPLSPASPPAISAAAKATPTSASSRKPGTAEPLAHRTGYDHYREFIAQHSSWFSQAVKDDSRLHELAKHRQHYTIGTLSHYLVDTLAQDEQLVDLMPAQKHDRGCGLIFTDQRAIALSQQGRRDRSRHGLQVWMVRWEWVHKIEIGQEAICFHYGRSKERFHADLDVLNTIHSTIPREIPVRMVGPIVPSQKSALKTKAGLAMIAGIMFALGSGFSLINTLLQQQRIDARTGSLPASRPASRNALPAASRPAESRVSLGQGSLVSSRSTAEGAIAAPLTKPALAVTATPVQCVDSFNGMAHPHAYATFNQVTQTLQVNLQKTALSQMSQQQFNPMAAIVAEEVLTSCQSPMISQVIVTDGTLRYQQQRSATSIAPSQAEG